MHAWHVESAAMAGLQKAEQVLVHSLVSNNENVRHGSVTAHFNQSRIRKGSSFMPDIIFEDSMETQIGKLK